MNYELPSLLVGKSAWTQEVRSLISHVAEHQYSVLISGPSGTGKELIAREIHVQGNRAEQPFIPVNCAAISGSLFSSQLFGHVRGAFTGADYEALGCFRAAECGTIFLDEVGELDFDCQAKLLRVLQERIVVPVGAHTGAPVDVRVVAATNRDLQEEVRAGRFRLDLYYRLNVLAIESLPLKRRVADVEALADHFLEKAAVDSGLPRKRLSAAALALLQSYNWPGNVRELQNMIERAVVFSHDDVLAPTAFPQIVDGDASLSREASESHVGTTAGSVSCGTGANGTNSTEHDILPWRTLAEMEEKYIRQTLERTSNNRSAAARMLNVDRKLLARKIKKYSIETITTQSC